MSRFIIKPLLKDKNALPSYNDYIAQCRNNKYGANNWKHKYQNSIAKQIAEQCENFYIEQPFKMNITICEGNKRRDKDNVEAMAKKLILDTLQEINYIQNDKLYDGGETAFTYDKNNSYIEVEISWQNNLPR